MKDFFINRFKESSTWFGLFLVLGAFGLDFSEEQRNALTIFGMCMAGAPQGKLK